MMKLLNRPNPSRANIDLPEPFVKLRTVCAFTGLGPDAIYESDCPRLKVGKYFLFRLSEVTHWLEKRRVK